MNVVEAIIRMFAVIGIGLAAWWVWETVTGS